MKFPKVPRLLSDAFIKKDNKYLAVKRARAIEIGAWETPGGRVEFGEKVEDALVREIKEEVGVNIKINKFLGWGAGVSTHKDGFKIHRFALYFDCEIVSGELKYDNEEISDHRWVTWNEFKKLEPLSKPIKDFFDRFG